jgi:hypothetical protein
MGRIPKGANIKGKNAIGTEFHRDRIPKERIP